MNPQLFILTLFAFLNSSFAGPTSKTQPCQILTEKVTCFGPSITDTSIFMLKDELHTRFNGMYFLELLITETEITKIPSGIFSEVQFENIIINENPHLTYIAEDAFASQKTKSLLIIHNPLLKSNALYKLADTLQVTEFVDFDFNALVEVPSHAFNEHLIPESTLNSHKVHLNSLESPSSSLINPINTQKKVHFKKLVISNNKIDRVASNAFHLLESCSEIALNNNQMTHIARHGFNLAGHNSQDALKIMLNHNKLSSDSFEPEFIELNNQTILFLDLSSNDIAELKEEVFKPLLLKNVFIDLTGNKVNCHSTSWLKKEENAKLFLKTKGMVC